MLAEGSEHSVVHLQLAALKMRHDTGSLLFFRDAQCVDDAVGLGALSMGQRYYTPVCGATLRVVCTSEDEMVLTGADGESVTCAVDGNHGSGSAAPAPAGPAATSTCNAVAVLEDDESIDAAADAAAHRSPGSDHNDPGANGEERSLRRRVAAADSTCTTLQKKLRQNETEHKSAMTTLRSEMSRELRRHTAAEEQLRRHADAAAAATDANLSIVDRLQDMLATERAQRVQVESNTAATATSVHHACLPCVHRAGLLMSHRHFVCRWMPSCGACRPAWWTCSRISSGLRTGMRNSSARWSSESKAESRSGWLQSAAQRTSNRIDLPRVVKGESQEHFSI